jgi:hypothetical protein
MILSRFFLRLLVVVDQWPLLFLEDTPMNQNQLYREVAYATGETVNFIRKRGFGIVIVPCQRNRPRRRGTRAKHSKRVRPDTQQSKVA